MLTGRRFFIATLASLCFVLSFVLITHAQNKDGLECGDDIEDEADEKRGNSQESRALQILYQVGKLSASAPDHELSSQVLDFLIQAMPAESALIFMRDRASGKLVPQSVRTANSYTNPTISRTIIRRTVSENRAFFTQDAQEDERLNRKESTIQKGVRSVVCVPLPIDGSTRGVLYLSRNITDPPFEKTDMELLSACALQLGLAFQGINRMRQSRRSLWKALAVMTRATELGTSRLGCSERCSRAASAMATTLNLAEESVWHLQVAGLLYQMGGLLDSNQRPAIDGFIGIEDFDGIATLVRDAAERLDGSGPRHLTEEDLDIEARLLAVASAFADRLQSDADTDAMVHIEALAANPGFDDQIVACLKNCHLDGSLYQQVVV